MKNTFKYGHEVGFVRVCYYKLWEIRNVNIWGKYFITVRYDDWARKDQNKPMNKKGGNLVNQKYRE